MTKKRFFCFPYRTTFVPKHSFYTFFNREKTYFSLYNAIFVAKTSIHEHQTTPAPASHW